MNSLILTVVLCMTVAIVNALPTPQAPAGPFTTVFQTAGAVAGAGFADTAKFLSIFPTAADSALGVGQTVFGRFLSAFSGYAAGNFCLAVYLYKLKRRENLTRKQ